MRIDISRHYDIWLSSNTGIDDGDDFHFILCCYLFELMRSHIEDVDVLELGAGLLVVIVLVTTHDSNLERVQSSNTKEIGRAHV